jgi:hypothetical protein
MAWHGTARHGTAWHGMEWGWHGMGVEAALPHAAVHAAFGHGGMPNAQAHDLYATFGCSRRYRWKVAPL